MPTNPQVNKMLKEVNNVEVKNIFYSTYRHDSKLGMGIADAVRYEKDTSDYIGKGINITVGNFTNERLIYAINEIWPDFASYWTSSTQDFKREEKTDNLFLNKFAEFVAIECVAKNYSRLPDLFGFVELAFEMGDENCQRLIQSFLEDLQNYTGNQDVDQSIISSFCKPNTLIWWNEINRFWKDIEEYYSGNKGNLHH